jgi:hypothetical protein
MVSVCLIVNRNFVIALTTNTPLYVAIFLRYPSVITRQPPLTLRGYAYG